MLRSNTIAAVSRAGKVSQRSFCLSARKHDNAPSKTEQTGVQKDGETIDMSYYTYKNMPQSAKDNFMPHIGNRDIVGPSFFTSPDYYDAVDYCMPSIRWAPNTPEVLSLREKEAGDWKSLSLAEKKQLYRNAYRQTFAEVDAPTGEWKRQLYIFLYLCALSSAYFLYYTSYNATEGFIIKRPATLTPEYQQERLASLLMFNVGHFDGVSSKYDFENNEWKKK